MQFIHNVDGDGSKTSKIIKRLYYSASRSHSDDVTSHRLNVNLMLSNITICFKVKVNSLQLM